MASLAAAPQIAAGEHDHAKLAIALDHSWRWFELRVSHGMQMLNFAVVAFALLSAAYVSALSNKLYGIAGAVALLAALVAITANLTANDTVQNGARLLLSPAKRSDARELGMALEPDQYFTRPAGREHLATTGQVTLVQLGVAG